VTGIIEDRIVSIRIGPPGRTGREIDGLYARCRIDLTGGRTPNKAKVTIHNLKKDSVQWIEKPGHVLQILAGEKQAGQVFFGDITRRSVKTSWQRPDYVTEITAADGRRIFQKSKFAATYPVQTTRTEVLNDLLASMGLSRGYIDPSIPERTYPGGLVYCDASREVMSELWEPDGAVWSIQGGALQVVASGKPIKRRAIVIDKDTGLIGAPQRTDKGIAVQMDLNPEVKPGAIIVVPSVNVNGGWRVAKATLDFDNFGDQWQTSANAVVY
jgi:hypothetical protein